LVIEKKKEEEGKGKEKKKNQNARVESDQKKQTTKTNKQHQQTAKNTQKLPTNPQGKARSSLHEASQVVEGRANAEAGRCTDAGKNTDGFC